jgi:hypothetical protein
VVCKSSKATRDLPPPFFRISTAIVTEREEWIRFSYSNEDNEYEEGDKIVKQLDPVTSVADTRAIGRVELYSKHEESQDRARRAHTEIHNVDCQGR